MKIERSAGAVIFHTERGERKYLLIHYKLGHWGYVKGHLEEGEKTEETIEREIQEEVGIKEIKFVDGFKEYSDFIFKYKGELVKKYVVFLLAETREEKVCTSSHEHDDCRWFSYDDAMKTLTYESSKGILEKAERFLKSK